MAEKKWNKRKMAGKKVPKEVPLKVFKRKCPNLEVLDEYLEEFGVEMGEARILREDKGSLVGGCRQIEAGGRTPYNVISRRPTFIGLWRHGRRVH